MNEEGVGGGETIPVIAVLAVTIGCVYFSFEPSIQPFFGGLNLEVASYNYEYP